MVLEEALGTRNLKKSAPGFASTEQSILMLIDLVFTHSKLVTERPQKLKAALEYLEVNKDEFKNLLIIYMDTSYTLSTKQQFELKSKYHFDTTPFNKKIFQLLLEKLGMPEKPEKKAPRIGRNQKLENYKTIDNPI